MGLTVHYKLRLADAAPREVRRVVDRLQQRTTELAFSAVESVEPIVAEREAGGWTDGMEFIGRGERYYDVPPRRGFFFRTLPGEGTEPATFGLAEYPKSIVLPDGRRARTKLSGWSWRSFCKTQYASNPRYGGVENFIRSHLAVIELLDFARELGLETEVHDEGHYAEQRDVDALRREIDRWNGLVAGVVGAIKDAFPGESTAPILNFPNFERLEAEGRKVE